MLSYLMDKLGSVIVTVRMCSGDRRMYRGRKTSNVLNREGIVLARFQILIQNRKNLRIQNLKSSNTIHHSF